MYRGWVWEEGEEGGRWLHLTDNIARVILKLKFTLNPSLRSRIINLNHFY